MTEAQLIHGGADHPQVRVQIRYGFWEMDGQGNSTWKPNPLLPLSAAEQWETQDRKAHLKLYGLPHG